MSGWQVLVLLKNLDLLKIVLEYSTTIELFKGVLVAVLIHFSNSHLRYSNSWMSGWQVLVLLKNLDYLKIILQYSTIKELLKGVLVAVFVYFSNSHLHYSNFQMSGWQVLVLLKNLDLLKIILKYCTIIVIKRCLGGSFHLFFK